MVTQLADKFDFDVALSFAGEDRKYVEQVAGFLHEMGIRVFYDKYEEVTLWGKDLYEETDGVRLPRWQVKAPHSTHKVGKTPFLYSFVFLY